MKVYQPGDFLCHSGDEGLCMYSIVSGNSSLIAECNLNRGGGSVY